MNIMRTIRVDQVLETFRFSKAAVSLVLDILPLLA